jgi:oligoendopeptidase F
MPEEKLPVWDLSAYYSGIDDPKIEADLKEAKSKAEDFEKKYRGKINEQTSYQEILKAIKDSEAISSLAYSPLIYAQNVFSVDSINPQNGALVQKTTKLLLEIQNLLVFFSLDLNNLSLEKLSSLANELIEYKHFFESLIKSKPHRLSEKEEIILNQKALTSSIAFVRLFDEHYAARKYKAIIKGEQKELSEPELLDMLKDPDREVRKAANDAFSQGLKEDLKLTSFIYNNLVEDQSLVDGLTKFSYPEESRHLSNDIEKEVVDVMANVVKENYGIVQEWYSKKKEWLGVDELFEFDRYAPFFESKAMIPYEESKTITLESFEKFSGEFAEAAKLFFDKNWIHAPSQTGKTGGAYCSGGLPDKHPLVLLNYQGKLDDVNTMAHELGHGVNDYLMRHQNLTNYGTSLVLAETASVFAEMLVFESLKEKIKDPKEKFALYAQKIEGIFASVFRQISMYEFEQLVHHTRKDSGELSAEKINELWRQSQVKMFGESLTLTKDYDVWWSYVGHFFHYSFYVYAYAFGELLVLALYAKYKQEGKPFVEKYLTLMRAGTSASPKELLEPLGIDFSKKEFWEGGIKLIKDMVEEAAVLKQQSAK